MEKEQSKMEERTLSVERRKEAVAKRLAEKRQREVDLKNGTISQEDLIKEVLSLKLRLDSLNREVRELRREKREALKFMNSCNFYPNPIGLNYQFMALDKREIRDLVRKEARRESFRRSRLERVRKERIVAKESE